MERPYEWVFDGSNPLGVAATLTLLRGVEDSAVIAAFGGDADHVRHGVPGMLGIWQADGVPDWVDESRAQLWLTHVGDWTLVTEDDGFRGKELVGSLGADAHVSVYWNVNRNNELVYAEAGTVVVRCQDDFTPESRRGSDPGRLDQWLAGLPLAPDWEAAQDDFIGASELGLMVAERITGQRLSFETFTAPQTHFTLYDKWRAELTHDVYDGRFIE